jgi:hypothetical protein
MSTPHRDRDAGYYRIRVKGHLAPRWATRFDGMSLTQQDDGTTLIQGLVVDQAALHGLLQHVRDTGLALVSVTQAGSDEPPAGTPSTTDTPR